MAAMKFKCPKIFSVAIEQLNKTGLNTGKTAALNNYIVNV